MTILYNLIKLKNTLKEPTYRISTLSMPQADYIGS